MKLASTCRTCSQRRAPLHDLRTAGAGAPFHLCRLLALADVHRAAHRRLVELDEPGLLHIFVKQAVALALDRKARERELVSVLLTQLCPKVSKEGEGQRGGTGRIGRDQWMEGRG